jgi:hypothetical protein
MEYYSPSPTVVPVVAPGIVVVTVLPGSVVPILVLVLVLVVVLVPLTIGPLPWKFAEFPVIFSVCDSMKPVPADTPTPCKHTWPFGAKMSPLMVAPPPWIEIAAPPHAESVPEA